MTTNTTPFIPSWIEAQQKPLTDRLSQLPFIPFHPPADSSKHYSCHHNDYLRLSCHPEVVEAKNEATLKTGSGAMASIIYGGDHNYHDVLREKVAKSAKVKSLDSVILTTCGWTANVGLVESLSAPEMPIYMDMKAHASLWDGGRFSTGKIIPVAHNKPEMMKQYIERYGAGIIIIDSYYSTVGSVAPLIDYVEIAEQYDCLLIVDEAHSFGMIGENGGGLVVDQGLQDRVPLRTVSLAKALGGSGGFIICHEKLSYYLSYRLRPLIFSSSPPPANSAGNAKALDIIMREPERGKNTLENAAYLRTLLNAEGVDTGPSQCQIISLFFQGEANVCHFYEKMQKRNVLFSVFLAPAVPANTSLARFSIYCELSKSDIEVIATAIVSALKEMNVESRYPARY